jgi:hypothetical protein
VMVGDSSAHLPLRGATALDGGHCAPSAPAASGHAELPPTSSRWRLHLAAFKADLLAAPATAAG